MRRLRRCACGRAALEGIVLAVVKTANLLAIEPLFINLEIGPEQRLRRQLFDGETNRFGSHFEALIADTARIPPPTSGGIKLGERVVIECRHDEKTFRPRYPAGQQQYRGLILMLIYNRNIG